MKEHMRYKADTTPPRSRTQNISLCFLISISAVILKVMLKLTSISPRDLGESLRRRRRRSAFIYHTFHLSVFYTLSLPKNAAIASFISTTFRGYLCLRANDITRNRSRVIFSRACVDIFRRWILYQLAKFGYAQKAKFRVLTFTFRFLSTPLFALFLPHFFFLLLGI